MHLQLDLLGDGDRGSKEVKLKFAKYIALIDPGVVKSDVDDFDGDVLQVLAPIPGKTALKWSVHFCWTFIFILVYLGERKAKQARIKYIHSLH